MYVHVYLYICVWYCFVAFSSWGTTFSHFIQIKAKLRQDQLEREAQKRARETTATGTVWHMQSENCHPVAIAQVVEQLRGPQFNPKLLPAFSQFL